MQQHRILQTAIACPGPIVSGKRHGNCSHQMLLKKTNDSKDTYVWQCHKVHKIHHAGHTYTVKDVKLSIRHQSWLVNSKIPLEIVLELIYLWSQGFSHSEIIHELKLSKKTEWSHFFREACICSVMD